MKENNIFIANLMHTYKEALGLLDGHVNELIEEGANLAAIFTFTKYASIISDVYETSKSFYSVIYRSRTVLEHFDSSKLNLKQIPLSFILDENYLRSVDFERYGKELRRSIHFFMDEYDHFDEDSFREFYIKMLLDEEGYNKEHWYFKSIFINELEFMLDFLLEFVEVDYSPVSDGNTESEGNKSNARYIPKAVKLAVWRRDLGRCVQCGSQENLEFDHIIPVSKGGSNTERNIQLLCEKCNRKKSNSIQ